MDAKTQAAFFEYLLRLGDDRLVSAQRLSEWCGHGPILEEDIALANMALDFLGQASALLKLAGQVENKGRDEDRLAYFRSEREFRNATLVELPKGDFGFTILRQFLFSAYASLQLEELQKSTHEDFSGICAKALKETRYHLRHSADWVIRLGDGTDESRARMEHALETQWLYTHDLFHRDSVDETLTAAGIIPSMPDLRSKWEATVKAVFEEATLSLPAVSAPVVLNGRLGRHSEHLGHLLSEMQILARSHPDARW